MPRYVKQGASATYSVTGDPQQPSRGWQRSGGSYSATGKVKLVEAARGRFPYYLVGTQEEIVKVGAESIFGQGFLEAVGAKGGEGSGAISGIGTEVIAIIGGGFGDFIGVGEVSGLFTSARSGDEDIIGIGASAADGTQLNGGQTLFDVLETLGLTDGLKLCLDAGDSNSYVSGQSWLDTSGNGSDFFLGADGSATSTDPTFNGTPGSLDSTNYWSFDGGDYFTYDTTNETWMQNLHKDNALLTIAAWVHLPSFGTSQGVFGTAGSLGVLSRIGLQFYVSSPSGQPVCQIYNGSGTGLALNAFGANNVSATTWTFLAVSINEPGGAGVSFFDRSGSVNTFNGAYSSPSASDSSSTAQIAAIGSNQIPILDTGRVAKLMVWEGVALTQAQIADVFNSTRGRFGV